MAGWEEILLLTGMAGARKRAPRGLKSCCITETPSPRSHDRAGGRNPKEEAKNEKAFLFLKAESEGFAVFPRTLSVEELG
jgi:hypothetical protein